MTMEVDVIEEIARLFGFELIEPELPRMRLGNDDALTDAQRMMRLKQKLRSAFLAAGYTETIKYSFIGEADIDRLRLAPSDNRRETVRIQNPLSEDGAVMRTCMLPSLIRNLITNVAQGETGVSTVSNRPGCFCPGTVRRFLTSASALPR